MRIDCHAHFTTEPAELRDYRRAQLAFFEGSGELPDAPFMSDEQVRLAIADSQLRLQDERGVDVTLLSPRASAMGHHVADTALAIAWAHASNDAVRRVCDLFPGRFFGVCQLPQTAGATADLAPAIAELERCVAKGFVGCNINPDPSGGAWTSPPLADPWWDPLWDAMEQLDVPGMIHVSGSTSPSVHTTGGYYLAADTIAFMQLVEGDLFDRHPGLRLVLPHGGGAVPYHWGRFRGLARARTGRLHADRSLEERLLRNVFFDTCVYHEAGLALLFDVIPADNILFGSELLGAVTGIDPDTGRPFDDTAALLEQLDLEPSARDAVFSQNARRVYPLLDLALQEQGR